MAQPDAPGRRRDRPSFVSRLLAIAGGAALGALAAVLLATGDGRVPAEGLIGIGAFALLAGLAYSREALWRGLHDANIRRLRGARIRRLRTDSTAGRAASLIRESLAARDERWRHSPGYRLSVASAAITAGSTMVLVAVLR